MGLFSKLYDCIISLDLDPPSVKQMSSLDNLIRIFDRLNLKPITRSAFKSKLRALGVEKGDILNIHSSVLYIGLIEGVQSIEEYLETLFQCFFEVVTEEGTIVVPTVTTQVVKFNKPFHLESTRPSTGLLAEYIMNLPDSIRSLHPVNSVCAIGKKKNAICGDVSQSNYGIDSPYDRMYRMGTKGILLGLSPLGSDATTLTFLHYAEARFNVPYQYNKVINADVFADGEKIEKTFFGTYRYLDFNIKYGPKRSAKINQKLIDAGKMKSHPLGAKGIHLVGIKDYVDACVDVFKEDVFGLLVGKPCFKEGIIPLV